MSPIGRVFIVLNVILAGTFVGFSGTFLQRQHEYKTRLETEQKAHKTDVDAVTSKLNETVGELARANSQKSTLEQELGAVKNDRDAKVDELKLVNARVASTEADLKKLTSVAEATKVAMESAFEQSKKAFDKAVEDQKSKDDAVAAKNTAEGENRALKAEIAALNEKGSQKDVSIAGLTKDNSEKQLLIDVAKAKGFMESMAVPQLAGTVSLISGRLATIAITDNPTNAEVKPGYKFAIYDASGYKGEARVTSVDASAKAAFCTLEISKGEIKVGDSAATHLAGTQ